MNACHQRCFLTKRLRQWNLLFLKRICSISQVKLIEHTMSPVLGQGHPILSAILAPLVK